MQGNLILDTFPFLFLIAYFVRLDSMVLFFFTVILVIVSKNQELKEKHHLLRNTAAFPMARDDFIAYMLDSAG